MYKWWHSDPRVEQIWDHIDFAGGKQGINIIDNDIKTVVNGKLIDSITIVGTKKALLKEN